MQMVSKVKELIYDKSKDEVLEELDSIDQADFLHIYMVNYNWDDGFDIPQKIVSKDCCELSTALMVFYMADGIRYLENKEEVQNSRLTVWASFLQELYSQIMNGKFVEGDILFEPPMSKVQLYKLKKVLRKDEEVFVRDRGERNLNVVL